MNEPITNTPKITFRIPNDLKIKFAVYCAENQVTQTEILVQFIEALIGASATLKEAKKNE